eukprot:TRINITY_DN19136_c0_g1_i2.p1 TRINITY_DN19136_c0_g1~~TRINITY_DN19136_c0_g1_i2.p1  ORF type:complete len:1184 (+),score=254.36 TRINITY_DN19136_c0_g1_i2:747-4298(+)
MVAFGSWALPQVREALPCSSAPRLLPTALPLETATQVVPCPTSRCRQTQALIAGALERISNSRRPGREDFYGGTLMYLVGRCLSSAAAPRDMERLFLSRHLFGELDWEHESIESMKMQILRCVASPSFVRATHGCELLAVFYATHPAFTAEVHRAVKNEAAYGKLCALEAFGAALLKAVKASEGVLRAQLEQCVLDWATLALYANKKSAERARIIMEEIHRHHHEEDINALLCGIYGSKLWRSMKVANPQVRENAARLLQYVFPLIPNEFSVAEKELEIIRQIRTMLDAMEDPAEPVRRAGVYTACNSLKNYWGMLPPGEIAKVIAILLDKNARDSKAPLVRASVAEGLASIVSNALSHPSLSAVLPQLAVLLHDRSPIVRASFVRLLDKVGECRSIYVHSIVTNEELLVRLAAEHAEAQAERLQGVSCVRKGAASAESGATPAFVAKHLAKLLAPSLFGLQLTKQVERCRELLETWPLPLMAMLANLEDIVPVPHRVKLAVGLLHSVVRQDNKAAANVEDESRKGAELTEGVQRKATAAQLRLVGILLDGAAEPQPILDSHDSSKVGRRRSAVPLRTRRGIPTELHDFVYEHVREADCLKLLGEEDEDCEDCEDAADAEPEAHRGRGRKRGQRPPTAQRRPVARPLRPSPPLLTDVLFALSSLEPDRLPRVVNVVRRRLEAFRGAASSDEPHLRALLRAAACWGFLPEVVGPMWERLPEAAMAEVHGSGAGQVHAAFSVIDATIQDTELRQALLAAKEGRAALARGISGVVEALSLRLSGSSSSAEASAADAGRKRGRCAAPSDQLEDAGDDSAIVWPRLLGLAARASLHLTHHRLAAAAAAALDGASDEEDAELDAEGDDVPKWARAEEVLRRLGEALAPSSTQEFLSEGSAAKRRRGADQRVPPRSSAEVDAALQAHIVLLDAMSVACNLSILRLESSEAWSAGLASLRDQLRDGLWRLASASDAMRPRAEGAPTRLAQVWVFVLNQFQQELRAHGHRTEATLQAARSLLLRVDSDVPFEDRSVRQVFQALLGRFERHPLLRALLNDVLSSGKDDTQKGTQEGAFSQRSVRILKETLPTCRGLWAALLPDEAAAAGVDTNAEAATPLAHRGGRSGSTRSPLAPASCDDEAFDGGEAASAEGEVREDVPAGADEDELSVAAFVSRIPRQSFDAALFDQCFA